MKLLLTSAGLYNKSIANALFTLLPKPVSETKIGFISTAMNVEEGNKDWYLEQLTHLQSYGFAWIDIVDIAADGVMWRDRLDGVDVVVVSGGNTFYLLDQMRKQQFDLWLTEHIKSKVYVGMSAGSIVVTPSIGIASVDNGDVNAVGITDLSGLSLVDFEISPHTPEHVSHQGNREYKKTIDTTLYGIDNHTAIKVIDGSLEVVSEGEWIKY